MSTSFENDHDYQEVTITAVKACDKGGHEITRDDGFCFFAPAVEGITPKPGDRARFYGRGIGLPVRGLLINGQKVFYRAEEEEEEYREAEMYGTVPQDIIDKWDQGKTIWSIALGGLGPGYEQAIQLAAIEMLRYMIANNVDHSQWEEENGLRDISAQMNHIADLMTYGLSGAQWNVALNMAARIYKYGPRQFAKSIPSDRKIQVSKHWPRLKSETVEAA